jgi:hypothetical protein
MFIAKNAFRDYKTVDELLALEPPEEEEMFPLEWNPCVLNLPLYQRDNGEIDSARVFSGRHRDLGFRAGYARPLLASREIGEGHLGWGGHRDGSSLLLAICNFVFVDSHLEARRH